MLLLLVMMLSRLRGIGRFRLQPSVQCDADIHLNGSTCKDAMGGGANVEGRRNNSTHTHIRTYTQSHIHTCIRTPILLFFQRGPGHLTAGISPEISEKNVAFFVQIEARRMKVMWCSNRSWTHDNYFSLRRPTV